MAIRIELPKELVKDALTQAASLRVRNIKASNNPIIKQALEEEERQIRAAINSFTEIK